MHDDTVTTTGKRSTLKLNRSCGKGLHAYPGSVMAECRSDRDGDSTRQAAR